LIELRNVWFSYVPGRPVLRGVSARFDVGLTVILGPNGSGKTTLLKVASGLMRPERGEVLLDGESMYEGWEGRLELRRRVAYVHERPVVLRGTVERNVFFGLGLRRRAPDEHAWAVIRRLGLGGLLGRRASELSAGQMQLISIARALVIEPEHLLLDDPLQHLDEDASARVLDVILEYSRWRCVVIATTDRFLCGYADRVLYMRRGVIEARPR